MGPLPLCSVKTGNEKTQSVGSSKIRQTNKKDFAALMNLQQTFVQDLFSILILSSCKIYDMPLETGDVTESEDFLQNNSS